MRPEFSHGSMKRVEFVARYSIYGALERFKVEPHRFSNTFNVA